MFNINEDYLQLYILYLETIRVYTIYALFFDLFGITQQKERLFCIIHTRRNCHHRQGKIDKYFVATLID